jgi:RNA polymerase sigma factor (sigma-70 family)
MFASVRTFLYAAAASRNLTTTMALTDKQLFEACRRGDEAAWEQLVNRYQKLIYTIPRRAGLDGDQAADVFQEVFTTLLKKLDHIEDPTRLHAWLVTTARRTTWRAIYKQQPFANEADEGDEVLTSIPDNAALPDDVLLKLEEQHRVRVALSGLDERCQTLLRLLFYESEPPPYAEIAAALGTSEGSIGPTRARCLQKLLRLLSS